MKQHECQKPTTCCCYSAALEPADDCPIHGYEPRDRCEICGKFMKMKKIDHPNVEKCRQLGSILNTIEKLSEKILKLPGEIELKRHFVSMHLEATTLYEEYERYCK